jgi:Na+-translocating ferredoxin:NAD+ oxidoreductase RnfG subunit
MEAVTVALIAAVGGILVALVQKGRIENKSDHGVVASLLMDLHNDVEVVENKLDKHIESHNPKQETKPGTTKAVKKVSTKK